MSSHLILLGTASSGKSTLAKRISKHLNSSLIDLDTLAPHFSIDLLAGRQVSQEQILEATLKLVLNDNMRLTGFVIDAIEQEPYTTSLIETLTLNNFNPLVIYLDISNEALSRRIKGFRADPVTGITYPARQIQQSISSFAPKVIVEPEEGDEKDEKEEEIKDQDADNAEQDENAVKEIIDIDLADLINEESTPPNSKQTKPKLSNKSSWEIIPKEILDRVIIPAPTIIQSSLLKYPNSIIIDATQHPDVVFNDSLFRLNSINVFPYNHVPKSISTEVKGKTDEDILKMYSNPSDEPRRQISDFGKYCPVDLSNGLLTVGNYSIAASYKVHSINLV